jgi:hypothetical protein
MKSLPPLYKVPANSDFMEVAGIEPAQPRDLRGALVTASDSSTTTPSVDA